MPVFLPDAYFTKHTEGQLRSVDDIPELKDLVVPQGLYKTTRSTPRGSSTQKERIYTASPSIHPSTRPDQQSHHQHQPYNPTQGIVSYWQPSIHTDGNMAFTSSSGPNSGVSLICPLYPPNSIAPAPTPSPTQLASYDPTDIEMAYAQANLEYLNYAFYSSQVSQSQPSRHPQLELYPIDGTQHAPSYEELARGGHNNAGSPMSEYLTIPWHHQFPHLSNSNILEPSPHHSSLSRSHLYSDVNVHLHPQSHTPVLSEASHSSPAPYSISMPISGVARAC